MDPIYLSSPHMQGNELEYLVDAFKSNWIAPVGPYLDKFENKICDFTGCKTALAVSSGTAALHLALKILNVNPGDHVLCPTMTFVASIAPAVHMGAVPVFVDNAKDSWNMDPHLLEESVVDLIRKNKKPKAIIVVHLYGYPSDMDAMLKIATKYDIPIIEDAAESLGSKFDGQHTGTFGIFGVFSFNGNKIITTSNGGALTSTRREYVDQARHLSTQARQPAPHYEHTDLGFNYRLSNLLAAVGLGQLETLAQKIEIRKNNYRFYKAALSEAGAVFLPEDRRCAANYWLTTVLFPEGFRKSREEIRLKLAEKKIESRPLWKPMHLQPVFADALTYGGGISEKLFDLGLCLPSGSNLNKSQLDQIVSIILK